jgi:SOS-response transcriptional repressor LexA
MYGKRPCLAPCEAEHFTFVLRSDALTHVNIPEGSRLLACPATQPSDGDLVIAWTPHGQLVRFVKGRGEAVYLDARHPEIPPLILPARRVRIVGVICALLA